MYCSRCCREAQPTRMRSSRTALGERNLLLPKKRQVLRGPQRERRVERQSPMSRQPHPMPSKRDSSNFVSGASTDSFSVGRFTNFPHRNHCLRSTSANLCLRWWTALRCQQSLVHALLTPPKSAFVRAARSSLKLRLGKGHHPSSCGSRRDSSARPVAFVTRSQSRACSRLITRSARARDAKASATRLISI